MKPKTGITMPDTLNLIIWLVGGISGGFAIGDLLKERYHVGLGGLGYGALGGVAGALILQTLIPAFRGPQLIVALASGAVLTVIVGEVARRRENR